jgi:hypothetical protein
MNKRESCVQFLTIIAWAQILKMDDCEYYIAKV